jgi:hypothetical protein
MRWMTRVIAVLCCSLGLLAADKPSPNDVIGRWVGGKWVSDGRFFDTDFSKANTASAVTRCAWSPDHIFVTCDQDINFGGMALRDLSIYTFAPRTSKFYFYGVSLGEEKPRSTALEISDDGERWTYLSSDEIKGKTVEFRTTNQFHGADTVEWWTEFSSDGGKTWTKTGEGKETRQK